MAVPHIFPPEVDYLVVDWQTGIRPIAGAYNGSQRHGWIQRPDAIGKSRPSDGERRSGPPDRHQGIFQGAYPQAFLPSPLVGQWRFDPPRPVRPADHLHLAQVPMD